MAVPSGIILLCCLDKIRMKISLKQYLNESPELVVGDISELEKFKELLVRDCKPFWRDVKHLYNKRKFIFRGLETSQLLIPRDVRTDRRSRDTPTALHSVFDDYLFEKFGERFRSSALFASTQRDVVEYYGTPFVIFPIGEYNSCFSPVSADIYSDGFSEKGAGGFLYNGYKKLGWNDQQLEDKLNEYRLYNPNDKKSEYDREFMTFELAWQIYSGYASFIPEYADKKAVEIAAKQMKVFFENEILPGLKYKTGNLTTAVAESAGEIMITCKKYYAIRLSEHHNNVRHKDDGVDLTDDDVLNDVIQYLNKAI